MALQFIHATRPIIQNLRPKARYEISDGIDENYNFSEFIEVAKIAHEILREKM